MSSFQKRFIGILLCGVMLFSILGSVGCATQTKKQPTNVFSFPKLKKEETKNGRVKKDPNTPLTMSEVMSLQSPDVY